MIKLKWGMIGGGEGSQIGLVYWLGVFVDGYFEFVVGVFDYCFEVGCEYGQCLGLVVDWVYGDWCEMLFGEKFCDDCIDLVIVVILNVIYFEIIKVFFEVGFNVLCEKLMMMIVEEGEDIVCIV